MSSAPRVKTVDPVRKPALAALPRELRRYFERQAARYRETLRYLQDR